MRVPTTFDGDLKGVKDSLGKDFNRKVEAGLVDENAASALPAEAYGYLCSELMRRGKLMSWSWMTFGWNNTCRHDNVKTSAFDMLGVVQDNIKTNFYRTKTTGAGGDLSGAGESNPKHTFANTKKPWLCPHFALGIWLSSRNGPGEQSNLLFPGGDAAHKVFERDLKDILEDPECTAKLRCYYGITANMNIVSHSTRKGCATLLASADCTGGFLVAICRRADWAINKVLDTYIKNCVGGDQTLGRIAVGLDPNGDDFAGLPPHFPDNMTDLVREALDLIWGSHDESLSRVDDRKHEALLQRLTAAMVYNHDFLLDCVERHVQHEQNAENEQEERFSGYNVQINFDANLATYSLEQKEHIRDTVFATRFAWVIGLSWAGAARARLFLPLPPPPRPVALPRPVLGMPLLAMPRANKRAGVVR